MNRIPSFARARFFVVVLSLLTGSLAWAAVEHDGFMLESALRYSTVGSAGGPTVETKSKVILDAREEGWVEISKRPDGLVLFARRSGGDSDAIGVEYKLVDRRQAGEKIVATAKVVTPFGITAAVSQKTEAGDADVEISVTPKRVKFNLD